MLDSASAGGTVANATRLAGSKLDTSRKRLFFACLTIAVSIPASAGAGGLEEWSVVASTNVFSSPLVLPGLPAFNTSWSLDQVLLNDAAPGADAYFDLERNGATELWHWAQDELEAYARVTGPAP